MSLLRRGTKKVRYTVQCAYDPEHIFEKVFAIKEGSEEKVETEMEVYCPHCDKRVTVTVQGKVPFDSSLLRKFRIEQNQGD